MRRTDAASGASYGEKVGTYDTEDPSFEIDSVVYRTQVYPLLRADGFGNEEGEFVLAPARGAVL